MTPSSNISRLLIYSLPAPQPPTQRDPFILPVFHKPSSPSPSTRNSHRRVEFPPPSRYSRSLAPASHRLLFKMAPAFVTGPVLSFRASFAGTSLKCSTSSTSAVTMTAAPMSRRQALAAAAALVAGATLSPLAASAKGGDAPKISIFGVRGASSPFTAGYQTGGKVIYKKFNDDEVAVFKRIVSDSKNRLEGASDSIKLKSWEDVRSRIRLEASDLRKTQISVMGGIEDPSQAAKATKAYETFKNDIERLDAAAIQKNQDRAYKAYNASLKSLSAWQDSVGF